MAKIVIKRNTKKNSLKIGGSKGIKKDLSKVLNKLDKNEKFTFILSLVSTADWIVEIENKVNLNEKGFKMKIKGSEKALLYFLKFASKPIKGKTEALKDSLENFCLDREV